MNGAERNLLVYVVDGDQRMMNLRQIALGGRHFSDSSGESSQFEWRFRVRTAPDQGSIVGNQIRIKLKDPGAWKVVDGDIRKRLDRTPETPYELYRSVAGTDWNSEPISPDRNDWVRTVSYSKEAGRTIETIRRVL